MSDYARMRKAQQIDLPIKVRAHVRQGRLVKAHTRHLHFASGSNSPAQVRGVLRLKHPVGVAVDQLRERAIQEIEESAGSGVPVFVDSGAFGEVKVTPHGIEVVKPITDDDWRARLAVYGRIARALGPDAYLVAPDRVGSLSETLERQKRYLPELRVLAAAGARLIVPLQGRSAEELIRAHRAVKGMLGDIPWIPGIPSKKAATPTDAVGAYLDAMRPARVHLLGLGEKSARWQQRNGKPGPMQRVLARHPATVAQLDSVLLRTAAGMTNGPGGGPRPYTRHRMDAMERLRETRWRDTDTRDDPDRGGVDYTDLVGTPSAWLSAQGLQAVAEAADLDPDQARAFVTNPDGWLEADPFNAALVEFELDGAWAQWFERAVAGQATIDGILNTWGPDRA